MTDRIHMGDINWSAGVDWHSIGNWRTRLSAVGVNARKCEMVLDIEPHLGRGLSVVLIRRGRNDFRCETDKVCGCIDGRALSEK